MIPLPDQDWWKTLFDEIYLATDARSICNDAVTRKEVDAICKLAPLHRSQQILDLCGGHGRHSIELCKRGYEYCCVYDYSISLLQVGEKNAAQLSSPPRFVQGDARDIQLASDTFHHVLILGNSLGYITKGNADRKILSEGYRVLKTGGWIVVDVTDGSWVRQHLPPSAWHEVDDDFVVCRLREVCGDIVNAREMVMSKANGLVRDRTYCMRIYEPRNLAALLEDTGFSHIRIHTDFDASRPGEDRGCMDHRVMVTARKL